MGTSFRIRHWCHQWCLALYVTGGLTQISTPSQALVFFNNRDEAGYKEIIHEFKEMMEMGKKLGIKYVVVVPLETEEKILKQDIKNSYVDVLTELSNMAALKGIKIAVEFAGLVLDCCSFHVIGSDLEDLKKADGP